MAYNIYYLTKEELSFELRLRDISFTPNEPMDILRKILKKNINCPVDYTNLLQSINVKEELALIQVKIDHISVSIESQDSDIKPLLSKINCKIIHVENRLSLVRAVPKLSGEENNLLRDLERSLKKLKSACRAIESRVSPEELQHYNDQMERALTEEAALEHHLHDLAVTADPPPDGCQGDTSAQCYPLVTVPPPAVLLPHTTPPASGCTNPITTQGLPSTTVHCSHELNSNSSVSLFTKIRNPLENYLEKFKPTNGLDINVLLDFLKNLVSIQNETSLNSATLFQLLPNYCYGPLLQMVINCKNQGLSIDKFHETVLETFVPTLLRERLKLDLVFRPQSDYETLSEYVTEIRSYYQVLKVQVTETELVNHIKTSLNSKIRNQLVYQLNPNSFNDLEALCVELNNIQYKDYLRECSASQFIRPNAQSNTEHKNPSNRRDTVGPVKRNQPVKCFNCGKLGHFARNCYQNQKN